MTVRAYPSLRLVLVLVFLLSGCGAPDMEAPPEPIPAPAETPEMPTALHWVRNSTEARAAYFQAYRLATIQLESLAADLEPGTWAVSVDADETTIDNSLYEKELVAQGQSFTDESWNAWAARREATAVPGVEQFLEAVQVLGGKVAVVTNRREIICEDTEANLRAIGIPFDLLLCRPTGSDREKEPRWQAIQDGSASPELPPLEIIMWVGDNVGDFPDLDQELRKEGEEAFGDFGKRFIVLPNPVYGSWASNPQD